MAASKLNHAGVASSSPELKVIPNDPVPRDEAVYLASLSPGFCEDIYSDDPSRPLPAGLEYRDLNPLNPASKLFYSPYAMTSAGQALGKHRPDIIKNRDRDSSLILADSGGYAVASGGLTIRGDDDRREILRWQEAVGDICFTLDHPTKLRGDVGVEKSQADCLVETLEHLRFYQTNRRNQGTYWLNILQGNDITFSDHWYEQVRGFDFQSFAFAGPLRHNFHLMMRRLLQMMDEKRLESIKWLHVLGTSEIETGLMLSAIQRSINKHVAPGLRFSFDTGEPSRLLNWNTVSTSLAVSPKGGMSIAKADAPEGPEHLGSTSPWPWPSALGQHLTMGDVTQRPLAKTTAYRDTQSNHYLTHMNLTTLCNGIAEANRLFKVEQAAGQHTFAVHAAEAAEAVEEIFRSGGSRGLLHKYRSCFSLLRHG